MFRLVLLILTLSVLSTPSLSNPLNTWRISCGVDKGAIVKKGKTRIFTTSSNHCTGGVFNQRSEITSKPVSRNHKGRYLFSTIVSMTNARDEKFDIFQMHDGRDGCAPPLKVTILRDGRFKLEADYKTGPGESCVRDVMAQKSSSVRFKRNGQPQKLDVVVDFLGNANFTVQVILDGKVAATGRYTPPSGSGYIASKHFYFKHGVYSRNVFDYRLVSEGMRVRRLKQ